MDLRVEPGQVVALVGESGSGKSVSMLAALGLLPGTASVAGSARVVGREVVGAPARDLRRLRGDRVGIVFQDPMSSLNPVHTVGTQVEEVLELHTRLGARERRARAVDLLDRVGIPDAGRRADDHPHEFSGGMRQRVMLAIALAGGPDLLIADEPTTALDVTVQRQIVDLVQRLQQEEDLAVVWITHDLGVVAEIADEVAVMYAGRVVEHGPAARLYRRPGHPYTAGLLAAVPRLDRPVLAVLDEATGGRGGDAPPSAGCAFAPRCDLAIDDCRHGTPADRPVGDAHDHVAACLRTEDVRAPVRTAADDRALPPAPDGTPLLELDGLAVHYPVSRGRLGLRRAALRAVDGVDLQLRRGTTLGLVGESGCGKSTLGRAVVGLLAPTAGRVLLDGRPVSTRPGPDRRRAQIVFQDPASSMNPGMRIRDVVAEPIRIHGLHPEDRIEDIVAELLDVVGLDPASGDRHPHEFSGGQRQRAAIARALAAEPELVVLDEAVSSLDVTVQAQIVELLARLQRERGLAYLFIAHDLAVVRQVADEVAVMYAGRIVEHGPRDAFFDAPVHPYSRALLEAVPVPEPSDEPLPPPLPGAVPDAVDPPSGCRFHPRCPVAVPGACDVDEPALLTIGPGRAVACPEVVPGPATVPSPSPSPTPSPATNRSTSP